MNPDDPVCLTCGYPESDHSAGRCPFLPSLFNLPGDTPAARRARLAARQAVIDQLRADSLGRQPGAAGPGL